MKRDQCKFVINLLETKGFFSKLSIMCTVVFKLKKQQWVHKV